MTTQNCYSTLAEFKAYTTDRGGTIATDANDDGVIETLLKQASRFLDSKTGRHFAPYVETRYYDVPNGRELILDDDLLEVITVVNGNSETIPSTEYDLMPKNSSPAYGIRLKGISSYAWECDTSGDTQDVIAVTALWGYHDRYGQAWVSAGTNSSGITSSATSLSVTNSALFAAGNIIRLENELLYVSSVSTALTVIRGQNYSTAAAHDTGKNLYIWQPMDEARQCVQEYANFAYKRRFGQSLSTIETISPAGVVLSPKEIPSSMYEFVATYGRKT